MSAAPKLEFMYGTVHDATRVCVDGFSCWVACITDWKGKLLFLEGTGRYAGTHEAASEKEAVAWLEAEAKRRGCLFQRVK